MTTIPAPFRIIFFGKLSLHTIKSGLATENAGLRRQLADQAEELEILKKGGHLLREKPKVTRYKFIQEHRDQFRLVRMIAVFGVSRSGYYAWAKRCRNPLCAAVDPAGYRRKD